MPKKPANKLQELTHDLQRVQAEFQNYKRRSGEERQELMNLAKQEVVKELLPLLDNIDRALAHRPAALQDDAWAQGVEQIGQQVQDALQKLGVTKIAALGQPFDPHLHEAVSYDEQSGEHTVSEELQAGYMIGDRVLRHAAVRVGGINHQKGKEE